MANPDHNPFSETPDLTNQINEIYKALLLNDGRVNEDARDELLRNPQFLRLLSIVVPHVTGTLDNDLTQREKINLEYDPARFEQLKDQVACLITDVAENMCEEELQDLRLKLDRLEADDIIRNIEGVIFKDDGKMGENISHAFRWYQLETLAKRTSGNNQYLSAKRDDFHPDDYKQFEFFHHRLNTFLKLIFSVRFLPVNAILNQVNLPGNAETILRLTESIKKLNLGFRLQKERRELNQTVRKCTKLTNELIILWHSFIEALEAGMIVDDSCLLTIKKAIETLPENLQNNQDFTSYYSLLESSVEILSNN
ncbi:MAG: hypothetical protein OHK0017_05560 [Patescibacteria group bacterium]